MVIKLIVDSQQQQFLPHDNGIVSAKWQKRTVGLEFDKYAGSEILKNVYKL